MIDFNNILGITSLEGEIKTKQWEIANISMQIVKLKAQLQKASTFKIEDIMDYVVNIVNMSSGNNYHYKLIEEKRNSKIIGYAASLIGINDHIKYNTTRYWEEVENGNIINLGKLKGNKKPESFIFYQRDDNRKALQINYQEKYKIIFDFIDTMILYRLFTGEIDARVIKGIYREYVSKLGQGKSKKLENKYYKKSPNINNKYERTDNMNENNELLEYIYENAKMGVKSLTDLINEINGKDNKIKKIVEGELKGYENFVKESEKLLKKYKVEPKEKGMFANISSKMGIKMEMMKDNSDARVADMLTKGFTMGNIDIAKKIDRFEGDAKNDILKLAKRLLKFGEENIELLKPYL